jgi:transcriptional regulator with XRE-family HTH domain
MKRERRNRMSFTDYERMEKSSGDDRRLLRQEELIVEATEAIAAAMESLGITQKELATRLGCTKGYVSQLLGGGRNLTLRTLSDVAQALESEVRIELQPRCVRGMQLSDACWVANDNDWLMPTVEETYGAAA